MLSECSDLCTQAQMSEWSRGVREPSDRKIAEFGERFGFELVTYWVSTSRWLKSIGDGSNVPLCLEPEETPEGQ